MKTRIIRILVVGVVLFAFGFMTFVPRAGSVDDGISNDPNVAAQQGAAAGKKAAQEEAAAAGEEEEPEEEGGCCGGGGGM